MFNKYIEQLHPHPVLNMEWYKGTDDYSEGDIEDTIVKLIAENEPEEYSKIICDNYNWSVFYHLTNIRQNILNWYPFEENADVLEIGCGMGAITGMLCDRCVSVTSVELSRRRAIATLLRCREKDNLEVIVGNINDIEFHKKFDYITLIGVLEYQGSYTDSVDPYADFLKKIKTLLKPNGKLLIGIENQYGLKYWCGAKEDHTGLPFDGMNQYTLSNRKVRTFSKKALELLLRKCGFSNSYFYYPMPDYKLPTVIYSQKFMPDNSNMLNTRPYYVPDNGTLVAQEDKLYQDILENGVFEFFSNSFLVECSESGELGSVTFASISNRRPKEYQMITRCRDNHTFEKYAVYSEQGKEHVLQCLQNEKEMEQQGLHVWNSSLEHERMISCFCEEKNSEIVFLQKIQKGDRESALRMLDKLFQQILSSSPHVNWEENILYSFFPDIEQKEEDYGVILSMGYLDMLLRNAFWIEEEFYWFDQEWNLENVPAIYPMYRALTELYNSYPDIDTTLSLREVAVRYGILSVWDQMQQLDQMFMGVVIDKFHFLAANQLKSVDMNQCIKNINRLIQG